MCTISIYTKRASELGLSWPLPGEISDSELAKLLFLAPKTGGRLGRITPDFPPMHQEFKQIGVIKQLLWEEYKQAHRDAGYQFSQYCGYYRHWLQSQQRSMRHVHKAGEKLFVDYSGSSVAIVYPRTGEIRFTKIFVAVMGASNWLCRKV